MAVAPFAKLDSPKYRPQAARDWCERQMLMFFGGCVAEHLFRGIDPSTTLKDDSIMAIAIASPHVGGPQAASAWLSWLHIRAEEVIRLRFGAVQELAEELIVCGEFDLKWGRHRTEQAVRYDIELSLAPARVERERLAGVVPIR